MRISKRMAVIISLAAATVSFVAQDASAQGRKNAVVLEISKVESACRYQVKDVEGRLLPAQQDTFFVTPGAFVNIVTIGTSARVDVKDDPRKNVNGLKNRGSAVLAADDSQYFRVRSARTEDPGSIHKVAIDCCESVSEDGTCVNPSVSDKMSVNGRRRVHQNRAGFLSSLDGLVRMIFGSRAASDPPVGSGGPDMDVDP